MTRHSVTATVGLAALLLAPSVSAKTRFDPELEINYGYTDNIALGGSASEMDDAFLAYRLTLEGDVGGKKTTFSWDYRPTLLRYDEFDVLDRDEHALRLRLRSTPARNLSIDFRTYAALTQIQGDAGSEEDSELFLGRRTDREIYNADFRLDARVSKRWLWGYGLFGSFQRFDPIAGFDGDPSSQVEDRDTIRGSLHFEREMSSRSRLGVRYEHSAYELQFSGDSVADALLVTWSKALTRGFDLQLGGGAYDTRGTRGNDEVDETGVQAFLNLTRQFESTRLAFFLRNEPSAGGGLTGTSVNTVAGLSYGSTGNRGWGWRISPRYARRDPTEAGQTLRDSIALRVDLDRRISKKFRLVLRTNYIDQRNDDPSVEDRSVFHADLGLVWSPWGGTRLAQR